MQLPGHAVRSAPAVSFMEPSLLISRSTIFAFLLLVWCCAACRKDDPPPEFPKTFTLNKWDAESIRAYWKSPQGIGVPLTRHQSGTFLTFLDTIGFYDLRHSMPLPFTGIELLNYHQLRIFNDGVMGTPLIDTVVNYSSTAAGIMTISWTPLGTSFMLEMGEYAGSESLKFFSCWLFYSYHPTGSPDLLRYTSPQHYYTGDEFAGEKIAAADNLGYGLGDTLAVYLRLIRFKH